MLEIRITMKYLVLCYGLLGDRMDNAAAVLLDVNDGPSPLQIGGDLNCLKSHDVMHCLDGDFPGKCLLMIWLEQQGCVDNSGVRQLQHSLLGSMM